MNLLDFLVKRYGNTLVNSWIPFWCFTPVRRIIRFISSYILPRYLNKPNVYSPKNYTDIIVSFTSFPARIDEVWQVVECMFRQSYQYLEYYPSRQPHGFPRRFARQIPPPNTWSRG